MNRQLITVFILGVCLGSPLRVAEAMFLSVQNAMAQSVDEIRGGSGKSKSALKANE